MTVWVKLWVGLLGAIPSNLLKRNGGDDGTRTRGLCRDRVAGRCNLLELNGTDSPFLFL
jgi:hypothetical protein